MIQQTFPPARFQSRSLLAQWTPGSKLMNGPSVDEGEFACAAASAGAVESEADRACRDLWTIRVRYAECVEIFVAGDFNRWRLPGSRLRQWGCDIWETRIELAPGAYRFACYMLGHRGFRRISSDCVECFIEAPETIQSAIVSHPAPG